MFVAIHISRRDTWRYSQPRPAANPVMTATYGHGVLRHFGVSTFFRCGFWPRLRASVP